MSAKMNSAQRSRLLSIRLFGIRFCVPYPTYTPLRSVRIKNEMADRPRRARNTHLQHERDDYVTIDDHLEVLRRQECVDHALGLVENQRVDGQQCAHREYRVCEMRTTGDHELSDCPQVDGQPAAPFRLAPRVYTAPDEHATAEYAQAHLKRERKTRVLIADGGESIAATESRPYVDVVEYVVFHVKLDGKRRREHVVRRDVFAGHLTVFQDGERRIDVALVFDFALSLDAAEERRKTQRSMRDNRPPTPPPPPTTGQFLHHLHQFDGLQVLYDRRRVWAFGRNPAELIHQKHASCE